VPLANEAGGRDNITVVVVDVVDDGGKTESAHAAVAADAGRTTARRVDADLDTMARPAGATAASGGTGPRTAAADPEPDGEADPDGAKPRRFTWRVALFSLVVIAVIAGAVYATWWFGRSTYFVAERDGEITIFRGRPGGVLWLDPTVEQETGLTLDDVRPRAHDDLREGRQFATRSRAEAYVRRLRDEAEESSSPPTTTTTTEPTTTTAP
jgi:PPM family protein phosphatase